MYAKSHHVTGVKVSKNNPCLLLGKIDFGASVFHQSSYSLPCYFCSGIMIEVEKTEAFHRPFPWNPLFGNY